LRLLDAAEALSHACQLPTPHTFHVRRADYLARLGDGAGARAEQERAARQPPQTALDHFLAALDAYRQRDFVRTASACEAALRKEPNNFWTQYLQALCFLKRGHWAAAKVALTNCLSLQPGFYWARFQRGLAHGQLQEFAAAEADFAAVLQEADDSLARWSVRTTRGAMWVRRERWDEAVADLRQAIQERPDATEGYVNLALAYQGRKQWDAALEVLDQALVRRPTDRGLYHTRALLHLDRKDYRAARRDFEQAVAQAVPFLDERVVGFIPSPQGQGPLLWVTALLAGRTIAQGANGIAAERLAFDCVKLGGLQHQAREYRAALASFDAALAARRDYPPAHLERAKTLIELDRRAEAGQALDQYLRAKGPPTAEVYQARGLIHFQVRAYPEAVEAFTRCLLLGDDKDALAYRGWAYLRLDALRPALADFEAVLRKDPDHANALCGRGHVRVRQGQVSAGVADAEKALAHGPQEPPLLFSAACLYARAAAQLKAQSRDRSSLGRVDSYQERSVQLLRSALERVPEGQRRAFWRANITNERELRTLRRAPEMIALANKYGG
jgi:tetratricopeptide (TPR) repeat protein